MTRSRTIAYLDGGVENSRLGKILVDAKGAALVGRGTGYEQFTALDEAAL